MILSVSFNGDYLYADSEGLALNLVGYIVENLKSDVTENGVYFPGDVATLMFARERYLKGARWLPDNMLRASLNPATGFGGLTWSASKSRAEMSRNDIDRHTWISDNPHPPEFDPRVVSDPGFPMFYPSASAIPVELACRALEEFCRTGTGDRPEGLNWVVGKMNGERL